ncbi:MAG: alpha/beta fold hydrolase [Propionicimonas sp.]|nr:alpha/beta fold hydrolase [Propionicimonas sp.]
MDIILIPGLWLDGSSWEDVAPTLERAGHHVHALTLPGLGADGAASGTIGMADWVDAVTNLIDSEGGPVVLVGHSGGGNVAWGAASARADRVARVVFVDTVPPPPGVGISEFDVVDGVVPFPGWDAFEDEEVGDLDEATRRKWAARTATVPPRTTTDPIRLEGEDRFRIPVTILSGTMTAETLPAALAQWRPWADEFAAIERADVVHLDSGHWPQFSKPEELSRAILDAVG